MGAWKIAGAVMRGLERIPLWVTRRPKVCLVLSLAVALGLGALAPRVDMVNHVDYFTLEDHPATRYYEHFQKIFGNDEFFVICFHHPELFSSRELHVLKEITAKIEALPAVRDVLSLANANETRGGEDFFEVHPFLETIPETVEELTDLRSRALTNPLYERQLISRDGTTAAIVVFPHARPEDPDHRKRLIEDVEDILAPLPG